MIQAMCGERLLHQKNTEEFMDMLVIEESSDNVVLGGMKLF